MSFKLPHLPLTPRSASPTSSRSSTLGRSSVHTVSTAPTSPTSHSPKRMTDNDQSIEDAENTRFPTVSLDAESISDVMAARLAMCLLGHMLYLKSQVPLPVAQLLRMSSVRKNNDARSFKKHDAFLSSFDLLSSHLGTTFTAVSTALARSKRTCKNSKTATVHVAFVLGPTVSNASAARARLVLELAGLELKVWGTRENGPSTLRRAASRGDINFECHDSDNDSGEDGDDGVPDSDEDSDSSSEDEEHSENDSIEELQEAEAVLRAAERLLSRTLAIANSDPLMGMAAELNPTLTHVLVLAPRRFSHPAWIPRQNLSRDMNRVLKELDTPPPPPSMKGHHASRRRGGLRTECVKVRCLSAVHGPISGDNEDKLDTGESLQETEDEEEDEEGEMIWWSWDGKLEGFADW